MPLISALRKQRQIDLYEFKASLIHMVSFTVTLCLREKETKAFFSNGNVIRTPLKIRKEGLEGRLRALARQCRFHT